MQKLLLWIGLSIFIGWIIAMSVNYGIYNEATDPALISPFVDGILFMALMLGIYFIVWWTFTKKPAAATIQLAAGAVLSLTAAFLLI
ncbi:hypothetical protein [Alkalicoccus saliphilus]|jgi:hypothetical protein|uniref:Uncharacterized protein n=1 Tax=Alkalicoccus saliphilus TaxID=200989 RepID=A0A2T4U3A9_9BACI|nr:hypothetical protein [Alkalicoccus saliphilus]PTL37892.1 hypothetical protein C6Y45_14220 [Alkalicoccus saliphilus]